MNALNASAHGSTGPYKAAQSYGPVDGDLFHGRDAEGAALVQFLSDRTLAVITAPSGTGKTSLLHARVLPLLEKERKLVVYARPQHDPLLALSDAFIEHLLPSPHAEAQVLSGLIAAVPHGAAATLGDALEWHTALSATEKIGHRLFLPTIQTESAALPVLSRVLRGSIELPGLIEHFEALVADGSSMGLTPETSLGRLQDLLTADDTSRLWQEWRDSLSSIGDFRALLESFRAQWMPLCPGVTGVVLVMDQFEELFTRFAHGEVQSFLSNVGTWFHSDDDGWRIPLHLALSMRKEFFADLVPHLEPFGPVERLTFFIHPMTLEQATSALQKPARLFGLTFQDADGCLEGIVALAAEDEYGPHADGVPKTDDKVRLHGVRYAPALLSLVGAHLWARLTPDVPLPLAWSDFRRLVPNVDDVFSSYLSSCLAKIDASTGGRATSFDALELLDRLATSTGFRNIIAEVDLLDQLPLARDSAAQLLNVMDEQLKLVRRESRRGGRFVEIMHERLILAVRKLLAAARRRDTARAALTPAMDMLSMLPDEPDSTKDPLPSHFRQALLDHLPRLALGGAAAKILLRSILVAGPGDAKSSGETGGWPLWKSTVVELGAALNRESTRMRDRLPLLTRGQLDAAIDSLQREACSQDDEVVLHTLQSVLADASDEAPIRIRRVFRIVASG